LVRHLDIYPSITGSGNNNDKTVNRAGAVMASRRLLIVGYPGTFHVGAHILHAAQQVGCEVVLCDSARAYKASRIWRKIKWSFDRSPARIKQFGEEVVATCKERRSELLLTTGLAPLTAGALHQLRTLGVRCANFLTDDPWNPRHRATWFLEALPHYDFVFSPRQSNLQDLRAHRCMAVHYLPFAYAPEIHFTETLTENHRHQYEADVMFAGGADNDRVPYFTALRDAGLTIALFGHDWHKYPTLQPCFRGHADAATIRSAVAAAKVCLCVVRRANRDGHSMRSYELPAMGGVILAESTEDHRAIFVDEGQCALFFRDISEMIEKARWLVTHQTEAKMMAERARSRITQGANTYRDRLDTILATCFGK
jgi:spore maturation protein CgeB